MPDVEHALNTEEKTEWPPVPLGILIMGKNQGKRKHNKQLAGRVAMAAALWHNAPYPKPYLLFLATDVHGPDNRPDALWVKDRLVNTFKISSDYIILRPFANCTLTEVRAARVIGRAYHLYEIIALTHLYHAPRTQIYLSEVLSNTAVIPVHPTILTELPASFHESEFFSTIETHVKDSLPHPVDRLREHLVEWLLRQLHRLDSRGRLERWLAARLRRRFG